MRDDLVEPRYECNHEPTIKRLQELVDRKSSIEGFIWQSLANGSSFVPA